MAAMTCRYAHLAEVIRHTQPRCGHVRLVAIDGRGGAGKSMFAARLARWLASVPIIHTDAFASWDNQFDWWGRLEEEVHGPLADDQPVRYRPYDWSRRQLGGWRDVPRSEFALLEGVPSARRPSPAA